MEPFFPSHIEYSSSAAFSNAPENCSTTITGKLICRNFTEEEEFAAGEITAFYLDLGSVFAREYTPKDIFDHSQDSFHHYEVVFDSTTGEIKDAILAEHGPDIIGYNWLILNRLEILPEYRGMKLGLAAIHRTIQQFAQDCAFVSLMAAPLQVERRIESPHKEKWFAEMQLNLFPTDMAVATQRLKDYYSLVGFREVAGSNVMLLNPSYRQPTLDDIGFE